MLFKHFNSKFNFRDKIFHVFDISDRYINNQVTINEITIFSKILFYVSKFCDFNIIISFRLLIDILTKIIIKIN